MSTGGGVGGLCGVGGALAACDCGSDYGGCSVAVVKIAVAVVVIIAVAWRYWQRCWRWPGGGGDDGDSGLGDRNDSGCSD